MKTASNFHDIGSLLHVTALPEQNVLWHNRKDFISGSRVKDLEKLSLNI